jgi:hypothetical protein
MATVSRSKKTKLSTARKIPDTLLDKKELQKRTGLMWGGVIASTLVIIGILVYVFNLKISSISWANTTEKKLIDKGSYSWKNAEELTQKSTDLETQLQAKDIKNAVLNSFSDSTTTQSTSTIELRP